MDNTAVVFPGQGSQKPGMGQDFYDKFTQAKQIFDEASDAIGENMATLCFEEDPRLDLTEFTQPAILTVEIAMLRVLQAEHGFQPSYFAGHSLGEYSALVAAGVIPFADAVKIVRKRGALMQAAVPQGVGTMAAVIMPDIDSSGFEKIVEKHGAEVANFNSLEQVVISGKKESVEAAGNEISEVYKDKDVNVVFLSVSAPFHSSMMKGMEPEFEEFLRSFSGGFDLSGASKVVSNYTANFHNPDSMIKDLVAQISGSVRWVENMRLLAEKSSNIYEVGPNRPLQKFFKTVGVDVTSVLNLRSAGKAFPA